MQPVSVPVPVGRQKLKGLGCGQPNGSNDGMLDSRGIPMV